MVSEEKPAGNYVVEFSAKDGQAVSSLQLPSGVYFYRLQIGSVSGGSVGNIQLWIFWLAPIIGVLLAGFGFHFIVGKAKD